MKEILQINKYIFFMFFLFISFLGDVFAYSYSVTVTSSSMTIGGSVTLRIKSSGVAGRYNISTSNSSIVSLSKKEVWGEDDTQSITLYAKGVGTAKIIITPNDVTTTDSNPKDVTLSKKEITITVKKKEAVVVKPKSSNNYLSSLTIDGYELDSKFNKETLDYSVTVKEGTEKIKINAQLADSTAKVTGTGTLNVSEGVNNFSVVVTAENGSKRTYNLKVNVKEYEPINVSVNNVDYTLVRKRKDLPKVSEYFTNKDISILENNIEGYYYEDLDYVLVGLKDQDGDVKLYIYDNDKYTLYNEQVFNGMTLRIIDKDLPNGYVKKNFTYNDTDIVGYQEVKMDVIKNTYALSDNEIEGNNFYLFYAINLDTKKEELYQYDALEKTVQRYNTLILDMHKGLSDKYYSYLIYCIITLIVTVVFFSILLALNGRKKSELKRFEEEGLL